MNKIWLVTQREFTTRVKKRSFIIMSILGPVIFAGFLILMIVFTGKEDTELKKIAVVDSTRIFIKKIPDAQSLKFEYLINVKLEDLKKNLKKTEYYGIVYIHPIVANTPNSVQFFSYQQPSLMAIQHISNAIEKEIENQKLKAYNIENIDDILKSVKTHINLQTIKLTESGKEEESSTGLSMALAYVCSLLIYMFILLYGVQVMRGVIEEKTNRIVEVIISSVKPFQLMMGKVLGIAMTAVFQFAIWIILSTTVVLIAKSILIPDINAANIAPPQSIMDGNPVVAQIQPQATTIDPKIIGLFNTIDSIRFDVILLSFLFYFIAGYLLYGAMFAAVGAAVDNESDTQQFVFPITLPLILAIMIMIRAFQYPDSPVAVWFSIIPLTSPIVMMARIPFGVPYEQVAISMTVLVLTFIATIWMAGKIYRTGILMYGKKVTLLEMIKWLRRN
jgi:ABC-2 type transport system permease protein